MPASSAFALFAQRFHLQQRVNAEEELAHDREPEVAVRQLDEQHVAVVDGVAEIRERVLVASLPFDLARELEKQRRFADQVERDVGERDVLLEDRPVAAPLGQPMAEHEPVVGEAEEIGEERRTRRPREGRSHARGQRLTRTPRGTL